MSGHRRGAGMARECGRSAAAASAACSGERRRLRPALSAAALRTGTFACRAAPAAARRRDGTAYRCSQGPRRAYPCCGCASCCRGLNGRRCTTWRSGPCSGAARSVRISAQTVTTTMAITARRSCGSRSAPAGSCSAAPARCARASPKNSRHWATARGWASRPRRRAQRCWRAPARQTRPRRSPHCWRCCDRCR